MSNNTGRAEQLQFLRFIAFATIYVYHARAFAPSWMPGDNGAASAVVFFIMLSGFASGYSGYDRDARCSFKAILCYMWGKLKKAYPLYIVTTLFAVSWSGLPKLIARGDFPSAAPLLKQLLKSTLLIQSWFPEGWFDYNGVGWFLSTIMFLYLLNVPLRALFAKLRTHRRAGSIFLAIAVAMFALETAYCYATRNADMDFWQYIFPVARVGEYVCGLSLGYFIRGLDAKTNAKPQSLALFTLAEAAALALWFWTMYRTVQPWQYRSIHWIIPNALLLCVFGVGRGGLSRLFRANLPRYLGDISFECFLIHQILIHEYTLNIRNDGGNRLEAVNRVIGSSPLGNAFSLLFCLLGTVAIAALVSKARLRRTPSA